MVKVKLDRERTIIKNIEVQIERPYLKIFNQIKSSLNYVRRLKKEAKNIL